MKKVWIVEWLDTTKGAQGEPGTWTRDDDLGCVQTFKSAQAARGHIGGKHADEETKYRTREVPRDR